MTIDPLHGVTLKAIVTELHEKYGWEKLGQLVKIKCFINEPSINSSLKFLRKTPWARSKVEELYIRSKKDQKPFSWTK
ncbi:MAG: VF530 family protein [Proteobacteria bacterium]|nr:VF530 family protein [Pseudomonadota bacterium]